MDHSELQVFLGHRGHMVQQVTKDCLEVLVSKDKRASQETLERKEQSDPWDQEGCRALMAEMAMVCLDPKD